MNQSTNRYKFSLVNNWTILWYSKIINRLNGQSVWSQESVIREALLRGHQLVFSIQVPSKHITEIFATSLLYEIPDFTRISHPLQDYNRSVDVSHTVPIPSKQVLGSHTTTEVLQCTPISFPSPVAASEAVRPASSGSQISIDAIYRLTSFVLLLDSWGADVLTLSLNLE